LVAINPTKAGVINPEWSYKVPSPAYDSVTPDERQKIRQQNPWSFLNVTLSPEDISKDGNVPNEKLVTLARVALEKILATDAFGFSQECLYLYRLQRGDHIQTAVVTDIDLADYENGQIKIHEQIKQHRADLLADHMQRLGVMSSPIALTYRNDATLTKLIKSATVDQPLLTVDANFGVQQTIWRLTNPDVISAFKKAYSEKTLYIIDGHHRAAATVAANRIEDTAQSRQIFGALFPDNELKLLGFNRWIKPTTTTDKITANTFIEQYSGKTLTQYRAPEKGELIIYISGSWLSVVLKTGTGSDASELQEQLLQPLFSINSTDQSLIENLPGNKPPGYLIDLVDNHGGIGVFLAPLTIENFLSLADSEELLPPKSTYFTPKIQSGVFLRFIR